MPKVKDPEFRKMLDQDFATDDEEDKYCAENEVDFGDGDACVRLREGIDFQQLKSEKGVSFEVEEQAPEKAPKIYFEDDESINWKPAANEKRAEELFYTEDGFRELTESMADITEAKDGGVMKKILQQGEGTVVPAEARVRIHYNAFHEHSETPFDSSRLRGNEQRFQLGKGDVVPGLDIAVQSMKKNELSRFIVKPEYAYGPMGCGPRIPPSSTIMYEVELLNFLVAADGADNFFALGKRERDQYSFKDILKYVRADKDAASDFFKRDMFREAISRYLRSIQVLEGMSLANADEESDNQNLLRILYLNVAQCFLNISRPNRTVTYARKALYLKEDDVKALYKLGKALRLLGDYDKSRKFLLLAQKQKPMSTEIGEELEELERSIQRYNAAEREQCRRMFSGASLVDSVGKVKAQTSPDRRAKSVNEVSAEFKNVVEQRLEEFKKDRDLVEILAGNGARLADLELGYIIEQAQKKELLYRVRKGDVYLLKPTDNMHDAHGSEQ